MRVDQRRKVMRITQPAVLRIQDQGGKQEMGSERWESRQECADGGSTGSRASL